GKEGKLPSTVCHLPPGTSKGNKVAPTLISYTSYRILLPAWMTEPWAATLPLLEVPRLSIDALRALSRLIDAHRSSSSSATSRIDGGDHEPTSPVVPTRSACAGRGQKSNKTNQSSIENRSRKLSQASRQRVRRSRSGRKGRKQ